MRFFMFSVLRGQFIHACTFVILEVVDVTEI